MHSLLPLYYLLLCTEQHSKGFYIILYNIVSIFVCFCIHVVLYNILSIFVSCIHVIEHIYFENCWKFVNKIILSVIIKFKDTEAEFKEFEPRLRFQLQLKYGRFHFKLYSMFQDLSRRSIETGLFCGFETRLKFIKFGHCIKIYVTDIQNIKNF